MESMVASSELSSLLDPGVYVLKIVEARLFESEKNGKIYLSLTLGNEEGYTVDGIITWFQSKLPDGSYEPVKGQREVKTKWEFERSAGIPHNTPLERDTLERNRVPMLVNRISMKVAIGVKTDAKSGFTENTIKQFLPMDAPMEE